MKMDLMETDLMVDGLLHVPRTGPFRHRRSVADATATGLVVAF
eukprot:CAMPEP_0195149660 /NCGR_PEP_ID=MMETSP0448-20130528/177436_1 /TAXON_ID=66468 /ORGANISM="Heterocapsa triquestra, Strain CCMP 448" /LENGTH=42 /DNA_ID= /DNA_START= /DNA_END= /DNA_ORIENTATION=